MLQKLCLNSPLGRACRLAIARVCDQFMATIGPDWRDGHHLIHASKVAAMAEPGILSFVRLPAYEEVREAKPSVPYPAPGLAYPEHASLPSDFTEMQKLPSDKAFQDTVLNTPPPDYTESMNASTNLKLKTPSVPQYSLPLSPPSSQTSSHSDNDTSLCLSCEQPITRTNLSRHMRNKHPARREEDIPCRISTCGSRFKSARPDNLEKHMRKAHGETSLRRHGANKKRKLSSPAG